MRAISGSGSLPGKLCATFINVAINPETRLLFVSWIELSNENISESFPSMSHFATGIILRPSVNCRRLVASHTRCP